MSVAAAYHISVCALFLVQGGMWTDSMEQHPSGEANKVFI